MFHLISNIWYIFSLEDETPGKYQYAMDITGMLSTVRIFWAVRVYFWNRYALGSTGMLWAVLVLPRAYRYCPEHTSTAQSIPVLSDHTSTVRSYQYCP